MKPTLVLDVDGVILNFCKAFAPWWNKNYMYERQHRCSENPSTWNFGYVDKQNPSRSAEVIDLSIREFLMTGALFPLMEETVALTINRLREKYVIHLVTAFPENFAFLREENLKMFNIHYDHITYVKEHKAATIDKIHPIAVVEDSPTHIAAISAMGYKVFVPAYWGYVHPLIRNSPSNVHFYADWAHLESKLKLYARPKKNIFKRTYQKI